MQNFTFYTPTKVFFGKDEHKNIGRIIASYGFQNVLLHYGQGSVLKSGLLDTVKAALLEANIRFTELGGVSPNPKISLVRQGTALCKQEKIDLVLAIGGGSVIDSAKAIAAGTRCDFDPWKFFTKEETVADALPVGTILTLAASGSEMSSSCVITNEEGQLKRSMHSDLSRPLFSVLNPELTFSVGPYQTACGVADIMMHTLERYFSYGEDTPLTDRIAEGLLKAVMDAGTKVMKNPNDYEARATLMWAGSVSHNDLTGCGRTFLMQCHQLEHELSGMYDRIAHGAGLCAIWPAWARFVSPNMQNRFLQYAQGVWNLNVDFEHPEETVAAAIDATERYFTSIGMPVRLRDLDVDPATFGEMADKCTRHGGRVLSGYVSLDTEMVKTIFERAN